MVASVPSMVSCSCFLLSYACVQQDLALQQGSRGLQLSDLRHREISSGPECSPVTRYAGQYRKELATLVIITLCSSIFRLRLLLTAPPGSGLYQSVPAPIPPESDLCRTPMLALHYGRAVITYADARPSTTMPVVLRWVCFCTPFADSIYSTA